MEPSGTGRSGRVTVPSWVSRAIARTLASQVRAGGTLIRWYVIDKVHPP